MAWLIQIVRVAPELQQQCAGDATSWSSPAAANNQEDEVREGIPTEYAGIRFRSRLEATWAAFFDLLQWPWEFEPFDLHGYIPDFVLKIEPAAIVEVKGTATLRELWEYTGKIEKSGWRGAAIIVGAAPVFDSCSDHSIDDVSIGILGPPCAEGDTGIDPDLWGGARIYKCGDCSRLSPQVHIAWNPCPLCGCGKLSSLPKDMSKWPSNWIVPTSKPTDVELIRSLWVTAKNRVQWRGEFGG